MLPDGAVVGIVLGCVFVTNAISVAVTWFLAKRHYLKKQTPTEERVYDLPPDSVYPLQQAQTTTATNDHPRMLPIATGPRSPASNGRPSPGHDESRGFQNHMFYDDTTNTPQPKKRTTSQSNDVSIRPVVTQGNSITSPSPSIVATSKINLAPVQKPPRKWSRSVEDLTQQGKDVEGEDHYITYQTEDRHRERAMSLGQDLERQHMQTVSQAIKERSRPPVEAISDSDSDYEHLVDEHPKIEIKEDVMPHNHGSPQTGSYVAAQKPQILPKPKRMQENRI
uniref:Uncharacterized protein LOC100186243 n=1 Tax=Phallusia mammillata TaxID=59560 RepID=A0A6F9DJ62_9ASCI|nr:uncharacterized protein LOC100186243 [Phallusia mammillata]